MPATAPSAFQGELLQLGFDNCWCTAAAALGGGGTLFALFGCQAAPGARHAYFLELLLPHLHLALLRLPAPATARASAAPAGVGAPLRAR